MRLLIKALRLISEPLVEVLGLLSFKYHREVPWTEYEKVTKGRIQVGDIIICTTPFWTSPLVNLIIPGKYDHVAIYTGRELVVDVTNDKSCAIRGLKEFLSKYSTYVIRRPGFASLPEREQVAKLALESIGIGYDTKYTWGGKDKYCSEFIWFLYADTCGKSLPLPKIVLGQKIIYPDDYADDNENWSTVLTFDLKTGAV